MKFKLPKIKLNRLYKPVAVILGLLGGLFIIKIIISLSVVVSLISLLPNKNSYGLNLLLVGVDNVEGTKRSDAISVIHINNSNTKIRALSIPRDTRVKIENHGVSKINHAFAFGGIDLLKKTVSDFLSIPIHNHVVINSNGIKRLINEVGGVTVHVQDEMVYDDFAGYENYRYH